MQRIVIRKLPSGELKSVQPYHVSMKGHQTAVLCRDSEDYGVMVKYIAICSRRKNVIVIIYGVVSNHAHVAVLAASYQSACEFADELKRVYAQWIQIKYREKHILKGVDVQAIPLEYDQYVRNACAYIPRNALDNGQRVEEYKWSGYRAMFRDKNKPFNGLPVCKMTRREQDRAMHSREPLKDVAWLLDADGDILPETFCDVEYLEQAFNHDHAFWLKTIGSINTAELMERLEESPRRMLSDSELYKVVSDMSIQWLKTNLSDLPIEKKKRLLLYIWRSRKTTVNQLARVLGMDRAEIAGTIRKR